MAVEPIILKNVKPGLFQYLRRTWQYRSLIRVLAVRDIKIRYSQTLLGFFWAIIQPIVAIGIYTLFFSYLIGLNVESAAVPYPLFVLPGVICWFHFTDIVNRAGTSLQNHQDLLHRITFPKLVLPLSIVMSGLMEVAISFMVMAVLLLSFQVPIGSQILFVPFFLLMNIVCGLTLAIWLNALTVKYRDVHHIIPYLVSFGIWVTPVFYPTTILPEQLKSLLYINPVAGVLAGYRWSLIGLHEVSWQYVWGFIPVLTILVLGLHYFLSVENEIVDHV